MTKPKITIGYLPVIDHLTLGVAQAHESAHFEHFELGVQRFSNWQSIASAFVDKKIDGAFILFPLALELFHKGAEIGVTLLGHREGQVLVVRNEINRIQDLEGKTIVIPHQYSTHHILLYKILQQAGLSIEKDVTIKAGFEDIREVISDLQENKIQGFIIAEPIGTEAFQRSIGKILVLSQKVKIHHIDCVLAIQKEIINKRPEACLELTKSLVRAGMFINAYPRHAAEMGEKFLGYWSKKTLLEALTHDKGHILFWDLLPRQEDAEILQDIAVNEMGLWKQSVDLTSLILPGFAQRAYREWMIDTRKEVKDRGSERTLPGNFLTAMLKFQVFFQDNILIVGIKFIHYGQKYPKGIKKTKKIPESLSALLKSALSKEGIVIEGIVKNEKGLVFYQSSENTIEPDRVLLKLNKKQVEVCSRALAFGSKALLPDHIQDKGIRTFLSEEKPITIKEEGGTFFYSIDYSAFRFLAMLLEYYG